MLNDGSPLSKVKKLIESSLGWGDSSDWTNQDFFALSKKIQEKTGISLSHVTLKRIWGKVKYNGLPHTFTLNALAQFAGYESWRNFMVKSRNDLDIPEVSDQFQENPRLTKTISNPKSKFRRLEPTVSVVILIGLTIGILLFNSATRKKIDPRDYSFSISKVLQAGVPNSVIFDYDAVKAPSDSVIIQQSWDTRLRTTISKDQHQHTLIYYFPGFFQPKLVISGQIVKEHDLLIKSDGWLTAVNASPVPVYFNKKDVFINGKMALPVDKLKEQNISLSPQAPVLSYCNVQDFGEIYSDNFVFETSLRNDYREGSSVCQMTNIYLLGEGTAIGIPLCAKGCESAINFFFTDFNVSGKQRDLSAFGVNFKDFVKVRVESKNGKARIFINDRPAYEVESEISRSRIIGIDFVFQGTGSVDYVKLSNNKVSFDDEF